MIWLLSGRTLAMRFFVGWLWQSDLYSKSELDAVLAKAGAVNIGYLSVPRVPILRRSICWQSRLQVPEG
jgi:hypothetical protein